MGEEQQTETAKNTVTIKDTGPCKKLVSVEIPEEAIKNATDEQYKTLGKDAIVPGFRKMLAYPPKAPAVDGARTMLSKGPSMLGCGIPFVFMEIIPGIPEVVFLHQPIAGHFGDNGSCGDRGTF